MDKVRRRLRARAPKLRFIVETDDKWLDKWTGTGNKPVRSPDHKTMGSGQVSSGAQLRKVLDALFPPAYLKLYHRAPHSVCSIFNTRQGNSNNHDDDDDDDNYLAASSEPSGRAQVINLQRQLQNSLALHRAKPIGLCPVRRAIYDQLFDELIRQVTVGCVEQGLLMFQLRNELRATIQCYRRAYESAVLFGLRKSLRNTSSTSGETEHAHKDKELGDELEEREEDQLDEHSDRMRAYYECELEKREAIIAQQRAVIKALGGGQGKQ